MVRWLRNILCGLSLLVFLTLFYINLFARKTATGITLTRSHQVSYSNASIRCPHFYYVELFANQLVIGHWRHPELFEREKQSERERLASFEELLATTHNERRRSQISERISEIHQNQGKNFYDRPNGFSIGAHGGLYVTALNQIPTFAGIKYDGFPSLRPPATGFRCVIPIWWVLPLLLIGPFVRASTLWRSRRRRRAGHCSFCGYDLRASSDKCPECGGERK
jgi:hypothetical protein